jgi:hypothetical protein
MKTWRKYYERPGGREAQLRRQRKYRATAKGKAVDQRYERAFRATVRGRFCAYGNNAEQRGLVFALTFEQFEVFWQKPCTYCHAQVALIGLDRVDNEKGYVPGNVVSCCAVCNYMKRGLTHEAFVAQCRRIVGVAEGEAWTLL